jgi:hypothetical protein
MFTKQNFNQARVRKKVFINRESEMERGDWHGRGKIFRGLSVA